MLVTSTVTPDERQCSSEARFPRRTELSAVLFAPIIEVPVAKVEGQMDDFATGT